MKNSRLNLLGFSYIPEILTKITTGTSCNVHLGVILIATLWALPLIVIIDDYLSVISAYMAIIRLGIELGILYVVVYKSYYFFKSLEIISHIWNLYI